MQKCSAGYFGPYTTSPAMVLQWAVKPLPNDCWLANQNLNLMWGYGYEIHEIGENGPRNPHLGRSPSPINPALHNSPTSSLRLHPNTPIS